MTEFSEKLRSIHFNGSTRIARSVVDDEGRRVTEVLGEDGRPAGVSIEHKSGRVDATAFAESPTTTTHPTGD